MNTDEITAKIEDALVKLKEGRGNHVEMITLITNHFNASTFRESAEYRKEKLTLILESMVRNLVVIRNPYEYEKQPFSYDISEKWS